MVTAIFFSWTNDASNRDGHLAPMNALTLLLVDDHALFREGLALQLSRLGDHTRILQARDNAQLDALIAEQSRIDLVLLDWSVPGLSSISLIHRLASLAAPVPVLVVSATENLADIADALDAGALGFVPKALEPQALMQAIELVLAGQLFLPATLARELAAWRRSKRQPSLSQRQREVLELLATGCSNQDIAERLGISAATVKSHVNTLFNLLNADNRTACVHCAREMGLL